MATTANASEHADPNVNADNIFFLPEKSIEKLKNIAESKKDVPADDIYALTSPEGLPDSDMVIPVDLRGGSENFAKDFEDDFDVMVEKLGAKGTAEGLLKAF